MSLELVGVTFDVHDPVSVAGFWAVLLDRDVVEEPDVVFLPGDDTQVGLRYVAAPAGSTPTTRRLHLHVTSATPEDQQRTVETALRLGGRYLDLGQRPDEGHVVLEDPNGDPFCVIEPGNNFLEGCGRLGEIACDGARDVGLFWHEALGWPLVWDQEDETAIQSPLGGTKVAWGGVTAEKTQRNGQRFHLAGTDLPDEVARLVALGATEIETGAAGAELADPDGNEFHVARR